MKKFLAGILFHIAMVSLLQDAVGKKNYMAAMDLLWVSAWVTVPLALLCVFVSVILFTWDDIQ